MKRLALSAALLSALTGAAVAKLPPPSDEAKAKAAETAAKAAWTSKVDAYKLCQSMDKVAAAYHAAQKQAGTPKTPVATPACVDPGPFAYVPPSEAKPPIEQSGAHSPPRTANGPPSTPTPQAAQPKQ